MNKLLRDFSQPGRWGRIPFPNRGATKDILQPVERLWMQRQVALEEDRIAGGIFGRPAPALQRRLVGQRFVIASLAFDCLRTNERCRIGGTRHHRPRPSRSNQWATVAGHATAHLLNQLTGSDDRIHLMAVDRQKSRNVLRLGRVPCLLTIEERRERGRF